MFKKKNSFNFDLIRENEPVGNVRVNKSNKSLCDPCSCDPREPFPCSTENCLNRVVNYECSPDICKAGLFCQNQRFLKQIYPQQVPFDTVTRGIGLKTEVNIKKVEFVNEYVGELISLDECKRRLILAYKKKFSNFYFLAIDNKR